MDKLIYKPGKYQRVELDKRFYMPGYVLLSTCPKCNKKHEQDLAQNYLSYPVVGSPSLVYFCCDDDDCNHEWQVEVVVRVSLELAQ